MGEATRDRFRFGPFLLDVAEQTLSADDHLLELRPTTFRMLASLVRHHGHLIEKEQLLRAVWPDSFVEEGSLAHHISVIRKVLAKHSSQEYIETVPTRGYRFVADVIELSEETAGDTTAASPAVIESAPRHRTISGRSLFLAGCVAVAVAAVLLLARPAGRSPVSDRGGLAGPRTVAVLPFKSDGLAPDERFLGVALADVLISRLGRVRRIVVRPIGGVLKFGGTGRDAVAAGRALDVDYVLDGRIQRTAGAFRATAHLIELRTGTTASSKMIDVPAGDVLRLENDLAEQVAHAILTQVTREEGAQRSWRGTSDPVAHELYLRARAHPAAAGLGERRAALTLLQQTTERDPNYALAFAALGEAYFELAWLSDAPQRETLSLARAAAERAVALDGGLGSAYATLGQIECARNDWAVALAAFGRALEVSPNDAEVHTRYASHLLLPMGRFAEASSELTRALALDPSSMRAMYYQGSVAFYARRYADAEAQFRNTLRVDPEFGFAHFGLAYVLTKLGRYAEARDHLQLASPRATGAFGLSVAGQLAALAGRKDEARQVALELSALKARGAASPLDVGAVYAGLGDDDRALDLFEEAFEQKTAQLVWLRVDPLLDPVRRHPRFQRLIAQIEATLPPGVVARVPTADSVVDASSARTRRDAAPLGDR